MMKKNVDCVLFTIRNARNHCQDVDHRGVGRCFEVWRPDEGGWGGGALELF